jgi:hypothetical protein
VQQHLSDHQIQNYQERKITSDQLLEIDDHLQACESCRIRLSEKTKWMASFETLRSDLKTTEAADPGHISYEQLEMFVDDQIDPVEKENIQSHLDICPQCNADEQDLRAFMVKLDRKVDSRKVIPFWSSGAFRKTLRIAGAAAAFAFIVWLATVPMKNRITTENKELQMKQQRTGGEIVLNDGTRTIQLDRQKNLSGLPELPAPYRQQIAAALTNQQVEAPQFLQDLIGKRETLMGSSNASNAFALLSPVGTVVQSDKPVFQWNRFNGADGYRVYIQDEDYNEIATSPLLKETSWIVKESLVRGKTYNWQVAALKDGKEIMARVPPMPEAKFQILSPGPLRELENLQQSAGNSHLVMGIVDVQFGLLDDAEREFAALLQDNTKSELAKKLLLSIQSLRQ